MENAEKSENLKEKKSRQENMKALWLGGGGLTDGREEDLCTALQVNFWVTMDHLHHLHGLSFTFCEIGPVVLALL